MGVLWGLPPLPRKLHKKIGSLPPRCTLSRIHKIRWWLNLTKLYFLVSSDMPGTVEFSHNLKNTFHYMIAIIAYSR